MIMIRGKERSGTTWLELLLRANYVCGEIGVRFKHFFTGEAEPADKIVVISKHPYDWWFSFSLYNSALTMDKNIELHIEEWNLFYHDWLSLSESHPVHFIRYKDLYADPEGTLDQIGLKRIGAFDPISRVVTPDRVLLDLDYERDIEERISKLAMEKNVLDRLNEAIDLNVMNALGYESLSMEE